MDMDQYKGMEEEGFWFEIQELAHSINELVEKYDLEDRVISSFVVGILEPFNEETSNMRAFFHYNIQSGSELEVIKDFMTDSYAPPNPENGIDLDDLIEGLGISLN